MTKLATAIFALALLLIGASTVHAEPRFAMREGMRCADCHINRSGGGMRTPFGVSFSQTNLSMWRLQGMLDPRAGNNIAFGANLRLQNRTVFKARTEQAVEGPSPDDPPPPIVRKSFFSNSFEVPEGNLYFRADLIPGRLLVYLDETVAPEAASAREAFVLLQGGPHDGYVKAGRFMPAYGLRILDDTSFMRQQTGFNYANADLGVEVGVAPRPFELALSVTNGSGGGGDPNGEKQVTAQGWCVFDPIRVGLSFSYNDTSVENFDFYTLNGGAHVGVRLGRLVQLVSFDWIRGSGAADFDQWALYSETDYEVLKGLFGRFVFEAFDPLTSLDNNERDRFILGASWFPVQLFEVRAEYRQNRDIPQRVENNADELLVVLHGFL